MWKSWFDIFLWNVQIIVNHITMFVKDFFLLRFHRTYMCIFRIWNICGRYYEYRIQLPWCPNRPTCSEYGFPSDCHWRIRTSSGHLWVPNVHTSQHAFSWDFLSALVPVRAKNKVVFQNDLSEESSLKVIFSLLFEESL